LRAISSSATSGTRQHAAIATTVAGLGYELVDVERAVGGLLRVTIDHPATPAGEAERSVSVDDCERVSRQLQHVLEVEGVAYERLEVSSPGLDRPLRSAGDFARFAGAEVELTLKEPFEGRKRWRGTLEAHGDAWRIVLPAPGGADRDARGRPSKARANAAAPPPGTLQALDFTLDEVRDAHLVPVIDFKGRASARPGAIAASGREETDGGRTPCTVNC